MNNVCARSDQLHFHLYKLFMNNLPGFIDTHNWHSTSNLFFLSLFYWKGKCSMENKCRSPLISCTWVPMCLYIKSSAFLVISFIKESILTLGKWSSCYCLLLQTQIDFSLASMKRSCVWALIDHFQCAPHSDIRKTLRKPETAKGGQSAEALSSECLQLLPGFPLTESAWFFWFFPDWYKWEMDGAVLRLAEFPDTAHWTGWCLNILPTCMNLRFNSCNTHITNLRTCNSPPALVIHTHVFPAPPFLWLPPVSSCTLRLHFSTLMLSTFPSAAIWLHSSPPEKIVPFLLQVKFTPLLRAHCPNSLGMFHSSWSCFLSQYYVQEVSLMLKTPGIEASWSHQLGGSWLFLTNLSASV